MRDLLREKIETFIPARALAVIEDMLDQQVFRQIMKRVRKQTSVKGRGLWGPLRAAITLETEGPDLAEIVAIFGKDKILNRIDQALKT